MSEQWTAAQFREFARTGKRPQISPVTRDLPGHPDTRVDRGSRGRPSAGPQGVAQVLYPDRKDLVGREHNEQKALIKLCDGHADKAYGTIYAVPNAAKRSDAGGAIMRAEGLRRGFPDLCLPVPRGIYPALYIEMKGRGGRVSVYQHEWHRRLIDQGNAVFVCFGCDAAWDLVVRYMGLSPGHVLK